MPALPPTQEDERPAGGRRHARAWAFLGLAALVALAYANAAPASLAYDDHVVIEQNDQFGGVTTIPRLFRQHARAGAGPSRLYRPVAMATLAIDRTVYHGWPRGYHLTSIAVHVVVSLAVLAFLLALGMPLPAAFAAALVFGVHPVHTEAVDSPFNRSELLATLGVVGGLAWFWRFEPRRRWLAYGGLGAIYFAALLCRESAVTLPALAVLLAVTLRPAGGVRRELRRLWPIVLLVVPLAGYLGLRQWAIGEAGGGITQSLAAGLGAGGHVGANLTLVLSTLRDYLVLLVRPWPLRLTYEVYVPHGLVAAVVVNVAVLAAAVVAWRRAPRLAFAVAFFYVALLPSTRLFADPAVMAERFLYLPSVGAVLALAVGLEVMARRLGPRSVLLATVALTAAFLPLTLVRNLDWRSNAALWQAEVEASRDDWRVLLTLSDVALARRRPQDALEVCQLGQRLAPDAYGFALNRGVALFTLGRGAEAEAALRDAIRLGPADSRGHVQLARLLFAGGRRAEAETAYRAGIEHETDAANRALFTGEMLLQCRDDGRGAREAFARALALRPGLESARRGFEAARAREGQGAGRAPGADPGRPPPLVESPR